MTPLQAVLTVVLTFWLFVGLVLLCYGIALLVFSDSATSSGAKFNDRSTWVILDYFEVPLAGGVVLFITSPVWCPIGLLLWWIAKSFVGWAT